MNKGFPIEYAPEKSKLTFIRISKQIGKSPFWKAIYRCQCGTEKEINIGNVKSGRVLDCGCYVKKFGSNVKTHKLSSHPLFRVWVDMKTRCYNSNSWAYKYYGGAGVTICEEWKNDFSAFYNWAILNGWEKGLELDKDKIPTSIGIKPSLYGPNVCCFLTPSENANNRRSNHKITFNGVTKNMGQWEKDLGFPPDRIFDRLYKGWSIEKALTKPLRRSPANKV